VKKQTEELKEIAKKLRIDINSIRVCKVINGIKRCGLKRVFKRGRIYYVERVSPFTYIIYRRRNGSIEHVKKVGKFTKFTKYGSCWEKKTVRINDAARDYIYEWTVEELLKDEEFKKKLQREDIYHGEKSLKFVKKVIKKNSLKKLNL